MVSKLAIALTAIYLIAFAGAIAYAHFDQRMFSNVFAVLLALPWIDYFPKIQLSVAAALNALIIYAVTAALSHIPAWLRRSRQRS
jgi:hypothetical protein